MRRLPLYLASLAPDVLGVIIGLAMFAVFGSRLRVRYGVLWVELADRNRPIRGWFARVPYDKWGGTTFGHVILVTDGGLDWIDLQQETIDQLASADLSKLKGEEHDLAWAVQLALHELTHVEQFEAACLTAVFVVAALMDFAPLRLWALGWWTFVGLITFFGGNLTAVLRNEAFYGGSHFEEAAYARVTCWRNPKRAREQLGTPFP